MDSGGFGKAQKPPKVAKVRLLNKCQLQPELKFHLFLGEKQNTGRNSNYS